MKITIQKPDFLRALLQVKPAVPSRANFPALSCLKLVASTDALTISASNLEQTIEVELPATDGVLEIERAGGILLSASRLIALVEKLDGEISFVVDKLKAEITTRQTKASLQGLDVVEFPNLPEIEKPDYEFEDPEGDIPRGLKSVKCAISYDDTRTNICGVLFGVDAGNVVLVATDGNRLHAAKTGITAEVNAIVPTDIIGPIIDAGKGAKFSFSENRICVSVPGLKITSALIAGNYPNWQQVVPASHPRFTVGKDEFLSALGVASVVEDKLSSVSVEAKEDRVVISSTIADVGQVSQGIEGRQSPHKPFLLSRGFIRDAVAACPSDQITFENEAPHLPVSIRDEFLTVVVMVRRIVS